MRNGLRGVQTRNGAAQFAVLSSELRERTRSKYEAMMWVTGTSSPWVAEWIVVDEKVLSENAVAFTVRFELAASTGASGGHTLLNSRSAVTGNSTTSHA